MNYKIFKNNIHSKKTFSVVLLVALFLVIVLSGCVSSTLKKKGMAYFTAGDYDKAVEYFQKEYAKDPKNSALKTMLFRAKLKSYQYHVSMARKYREIHRKDDAVKEYRMALSVFPLNKKLEDEYNAYAGPKRAPQEAFSSTIKPPVNLDVDTKEKISIKLPAAPIKNIFKILGKSFNINIIFDKDFRDFVYGLEIDGVGFYQILNQLCMVSNSRYRVLDSTSIMVYPDTTFKRRTFDLQGVKVFYLSNVKVEDAKKNLMTIFRDQRIQAQEDKNLNSIIIKADHDTLKDIERFLYNIDKEKSEVEIDVQIMEVNRNIVNEMGTNFGTPFLSVAAGPTGADGAIQSPFNVSDIGDSKFFITIPSAALNFMASDDNTKIISKPNLRGVDGEEMTFKVGEERPVPQTSFQSIAAGGVSTVPMTTYTYRPIGVEVKVTPYVHQNNEITLELKLSLTSVIGYVDAFPIMGNRELENVIRLKEGETNIVGGFIEDEVRDTIAGLPGFSKIPILGKLFGGKRKDVKQKDLIFSITPRVIRKLDVSGPNQEAIWLNAQLGPGGETGGTPPGRTPEDRGGRPQAGANRVMIGPTNRTLPVNSFAHFTIRTTSSVDISTLNVSGSVDGPKATIEELKTDFVKGGAKVFKNFSDNSFDIGISNLGKGSRSVLAGQIKVKFLEKGSYVIRIDSSNALGKDGKNIELESVAAEVKITEGSKKPNDPRRNERDRRDDGRGGDDERRREGGDKKIKERN